ncbi:MAG: hypothetical protein RML12_01560 [Xanthomonadales bacterium]|nr:hypothetical protein [Xanthomonadales bacterium]
MRERVAASRAELDRHRAERARLDEAHRQALERYRAVRAEFEARLRPR